MNNFNEQSAQKQKQNNHDAYSNLSKSSLIKQLIGKEKCINQLQGHFKVLQDEKNWQIDDYRQKLKQQIDNNEKAVKNLGDIIKLTSLLISKFDTLYDFNSQTYKIKFQAEAKASPKNTLKNGLKSLSQIQEQQEMDQNYFSEITNQAIKNLTYISSLIDSVNQNDRKIKNQLINVKNQLNITVNQLSGIKNQLNDAKNELKNVKNQLKNTKISLQKLKSQAILIKRQKQPQKQIEQLKKQINQLTLKIQNFRKLLDDNQLARVTLIKNIATALTEQRIKQLQKFKIPELIYQIKKMAYQITELKKQKNYIMNKLMIEGKRNESRFQDLLQQFKIICHHDKKVEKICFKS